MECINPRCQNELGEGEGYLAEFRHLVDHPHPENLQKWICMPCLSLLRRYGFPKPVVNNWFEVKLGQFRTLINPSGPVKPYWYPRLYGHTLDGRWFRDSSGVVVLYTCPDRARICHPLPVAVFGIGEDSTSELSNAKFRVA
jgi:hypothetical protein